MINQTYFQKAVRYGAVFFVSFCAISQGYEGIDVREYNLDLSVSDSSNIIRVHEDIYFFRRTSTAAISFDLVGPRVGDGKELVKGMTVHTCKLQGEAVPFIQDQDKIFLKLPQSTSISFNEKQELHLELSFSGIPTNGLIIGNNMFGDRTFFADNWPNRAHNWFACNDHVSDKAEFNVTVHAPEKYEVVANGVLVRQAVEKGGTKVHQFESDIPLPVKVMVVGIADLVIQNFTAVNGIPVSGAVYPQNQTKALYDLKLSPDILKFYIDLFGEYPFEKLMGVQSTTMFGGMENAGCIFYDEGSLDGKRTSETLLAHEIVHQWFGNSASETDWSHLWLSEGFATYFTNVYIERKMGEEAFRMQLKSDRNRVVNFNTYFNEPLVDQNTTLLMELLNANAYQKGGWVLHMLRRKIGDDAFFLGIKQYYASYQFANASSDDFRKVMAASSGQNLDAFFQQWVYTAGLPALDVEGKQNGSNYTITLRQVQKGSAFQFPILVKLVLKNGKSIEKVLEVTEKTTQLTMEIPSPVQSVLLDPNCDLLFDLKSKNM
jgi:aminopeptidase N